MRFRKISILIILILLCTCSICIVAGSSSALAERVVPGYDLVKKPSFEGYMGLKWNLTRNGTTTKFVSPGLDNRLKPLPFIMYRNISGAGTGYPAAGNRSWAVSPNPSYFMGGTGMITESGTVKCIDPEGGIFLIITADGNHYLPSNLPEKYAKDGTRVEFKAIKMPINPAYRMMGTPVRIISMTPDLTNKRIIETTGTVTWVSLEGPFYGIIADDGTRYDPLNLPDEYAHDGFRIGFTGTEEPDMASIHMWGTIITITGTTPISQDGTYDKGVFVDYKRTGGLAGFDDHLTVYENGAAVVTTKNGGNRYTLSSKELNDLSVLFESSGFNSVNQKDLPMFKVRGNDFFSYVIEYRGHKVEAIEYAFPESLDPVIERLNELVLHGAG